MGCGELVDGIGAGVTGRLGVALAPVSPAGGWCWYVGPGGEQTRVDGIGPGLVWEMKTRDGVGSGWCGDCLGPVGCPGAAGWRSDLGGSVPSVEAVCSEGALAFRMSGWGMAYVPLVWGIGCMAAPGFAGPFLP